MDRMEKFGLLFIGIVLILTRLQKEGIRKKIFLLELNIWGHMMKISTEVHFLTIAMLVFLITCTF